jgi:hypothetical protein
MMCLGRCAEGWIREQHPELQWPHPSAEESDGQGLMAGCQSAL